jgi:hypothetical protein
MQGSTFEASAVQRNPFAPEPLSFSNFGTVEPTHAETEEPGTFTFKDLQSLQDISGPTPTVRLMSVRPSVAACV